MIDSRKTSETGGKGATRGLIWFIWSLWFNQTNQTNQSNQPFVTRSLRA
jgi:hypothetical protein